MSNTLFFISDLHFGHKNIINFAGCHRGGSNVEEHDEWIIEQWNSVVKKKDTVYVLGDVAFSREGLAKCSRLLGNKNLILGNHDRYRVEEYSQYFRVRSGIFKHAGHWLTHAPIHSESLRNIDNIHGHMHHKKIDDDRYINVCVEQVGGVPISIDEIRNKKAELKKGDTVATLV